MRAVDLFAGCGGLSLGLDKAGIEVAAAFEYWPVAAACYKENFSHPLFMSDLSDTKTACKDIKSFKPDLIAGGPPCQDFSQAGLRREGDRASLTDSFAEIVASVRPRWFLMENVERALKSKALKRALKVFEDAGYGLTLRVLDASLCGAPQSRKRFFCIGHLDGPDDELGHLLDSRQRKKPMTVRQYLRSEIDTEFYYRHPRNYCRRAVYSIDEPAPTMRGVNRPVPKGYPGHPGDAAPLSGAIRPLSTLERARIQTFPKSFKWLGTKTSVEQMIGNAVPVELGRYVAEAIVLADTNGVTATTPTDRFWPDIRRTRAMRSAV